MVAAAERRMLAAHVHLEVLKEVMILVAGEGHEDADGAAEGRVDEGLAATGNEGGLLQGHDRLADVEARDRVGLLGGAVEEAPVPEGLVARWILVDVVVYAAGQADLRTDSGGFLSDC